MRVTRGLAAGGLLWMDLAYPCQVRAAAADDVFRGLDPLTVPVNVLHTRIVREAINVGRVLSPGGRRAMHQSMNRFWLWAEGYCQGDARCLRNQYWNYLAAVPKSVYRVGQWTVYDTGIYGLEFADEDLQSMDSDRFFIWDLQLTWPRVDSPASPMSGHGALAGAPVDALAARVHTVMADWVRGGWERSLDVHLTGINDCYVSASITGSTYTGGAHPNEDFSTFNWNVKGKRTLQNTDLFLVDKEWQSEIAALYRRRLKANGSDLSEWALSADGMNWLFKDGFVVTDNGLRFVEHEGATRNENVPAIELSWHDLAPWLIPGADCSMPSSSDAR